MKTSSKLLQNWSVLWQYSRKLHLQVTAFFKYWLNTFEYYHNTYEYCYNSCEYWAGEYTLSMFQEHETLMMILVYVDSWENSSSYVPTFYSLCYVDYHISSIDSVWDNAGRPVRPPTDLCDEEEIPYKFSHHLYQNYTHSKHQGSFKNLDDRKGVEGSKKQLLSHS